MSKLSKKEQDKIAARDYLREKAFSSNLSNTSILMKRMWELKDETSRIFSEMEMYLAMNPTKENLKMKKGLELVARTLIESGNKILHYTKDRKEIEVSQEEIINLDR